MGANILNRKGTIWLVAAGVLVCLVKFMADTGFGCSGGDNCVIEKCNCTAGLEPEGTATCKCGKICIVHAARPDNPRCNGSVACNCGLSHSSYPERCDCGSRCSKGTTPCGLQRGSVGSGDSLCKCGYSYCICGKGCSESRKICKSENECRWQGKEPWIEVQKQKPIPKELLANYQQGVALIKLGKWAEAIPWLGKAVDPEYADCRVANAKDLTYEDFFPRRELGIAQYQLADYSEAMRILEESLAGEETDRTRYYLDLSRSQYLNQTKSDKQLPKISVGFPVGIAYLKELRGALEGKINDDFFVSAVAINGQNLSLPLSQKVFLFNEEVALGKGLNEVVISATDLTGKTSQEKVLIFADVDGPLISLDYQILEQNTTTQKILLTGGITDDTSIQEVVIQGKTLPIAPAKGVELNTELAIPTGESSISIIAKDELGNITQGDLVIHEPAMAANRILLAYLGHSLYFGNPSQTPKPDDKRFAQVHSSPPVIEVKDITDQHTFFSESAYLEGRVRSLNDITALTINGEPFWKRRGKNIFFSTVIGLREGENQIVIESQDAAGNISRKKITVFRKIPQVRTIASRMCITISPFEHQEAVSRLKDIIYDQLIAAFINQQRFNLVERKQLEEVLLEQKLSRTELVKTSSVTRLGQILAADAVMIGTIHETSQAVEVYARLVDTGTGIIIASEDAYCEGKRQEDISKMANGLALKFKNSFPLVEGQIIKRDGKAVFQDLGTQVNMRPYRKLIVYCQQEPIVHPVTKKPMEIDTEELGEIAVTKVFSYASCGDIIKEKKDKNIKSKDKVISK